MAVCDGCGRAVAGTEPGDGGAYCPACADRRADDPAVEVQGRQLLRSEAEAQGVLTPEDGDDADAQPARRHR